MGDVVQLVRTLPCHGRGRGFESRRPRHSFHALPRESAISSWSHLVQLRQCLPGRIVVGVRGYSFPARKCRRGSYSAFVPAPLPTELEWTLRLIGPPRNGLRFNALMPCPRRCRDTNAWQWSQRLSVAVGYEKGDGLGRIARPRTSTRYECPDCFQ